MPRVVRWFVMNRAEPADRWSCRWNHTQLHPFRIETAEICLFGYTTSSFSYFVNTLTKRVDLSSLFLPLSILGFIECSSKFISYRYPWAFSLSGGFILSNKQWHKICLLWAWGYLGNRTEACNWFPCQPECEYCHDLWSRATTCINADEKSHMFICK